MTPVIRHRRRRRRPTLGDRGSGSVWLLALCMVLAVVAVSSVLVGGAIIARHRAGSAADLAALAAAQRHLEPGGSPPCDAAAAIADAMRVELIRCRLSGDQVDVTVALDVRIGQWAAGRVEAHARAGPTGPYGSPTTNGSDR